MKRRVLFYVQHLLGIGHLKRAEILAEAMVAAGLEVTVALGGRPLPEVPFHGVKVAPLPSASIANEDFSMLLDAKGRHVDDAWRATRCDALLALYREVDPDVVLIELFPFGRRQFAFELVPLLRTMRGETERAVVACSVRDILVASKKPDRDAETIRTIRRLFDVVLVHGDPALVRFDATFAAADRFRDLIRYTGYVTSAVAAPMSSGSKDEVSSRREAGPSARHSFSPPQPRDR